MLHRLCALVRLSAELWHVPKCKALHTSKALHVYSKCKQRACRINVRLAYYFHNENSNENSNIKNISIKLVTVEAYVPQRSI